MFATENSGMYMPVAPAYGNNNGGFGFGGDSGAWLILFLLCIFGGNGFGGYGGMNAGLNYDFPWLLQSQGNTDRLITNGFDNAAIQSTLSGIQSSITSGFGDTQLGIAGINQAICSTGNGVTAAVTGAQNALAQQMYANQLADLNRSFDAQVANTAGLTNVSQQLAQCCCDNRLATAQTQALVQSENCADRTALANGIRDIITNQTANTQAILDKLCQQEIDALKTANSNLQTQVLMKDLAASQNAQTAAIEAGQRALANEVEQYVAPNPKPAYIVSSPYCCNQNYGCGCGM